MDHKIDVKVCERGGYKIGNIAKSDTLKPSNCKIEDCFLCSREGGDDCSQGCAAYRLECLEYENSALVLYIMEKLIEMGIVVVWSIMQALRAKKKTTRCGTRRGRPR